MDKILFVSTSMKPAPGIVRPSATREVSRIVQRFSSHAGWQTELLDLRSEPFPWFCALDPDQVGSQSVTRAKALIHDSSLIFFAMPCYWGGLSGASKNFFEVLAGPAYDGSGTEQTIFNGRNAAVFLIGSDNESARLACGHVTWMFNKLGLRLVDEPISIGNPRQNPQELKRGIVKGFDLVSQFSSRSDNRDEKSALQEGLS